MAEAFDPYLHWLGIRDPQRPPNHYRLLGVELFESDPEVISNAADRQMAHVRTFQSGRHSAESQKLLNELAAAKVCLLNPEKKAAYDVQLRAEQAAAASSQGEPALLEEAVARPRKSVLLWISGSVAAGIVLLAAALTMDFRGRELSESNQDAADDEGEASFASDAPGIHPRIGRAPFERDAAESSLSVSPSEKQSAADSTAKPNESQATEGRPTRKFRPPPPMIGRKADRFSTASPPDVSVEPKPPAIELPPFRQSITAATQAMRGRDVSAARRHFSLADKAATPREEEELRRLGDVLEAWEAFWTAVQKGILSCRVGEILLSDGGSVEVVDRANGKITVRSSAETRRKNNAVYGWRNLPGWLAMGLADKKLAENTACLSKAAFFLVDPEGDVRQAAAWCEESRRRGFPPPPGLSHALAEALAAVSPANASKLPTLPPRPRLPVPDAAAVKGEEAKIRKRFTVRISQAKTPVDKGILAGELVREAEEVTQDPVACFAMLAVALDLALAAGSPARFHEVTEQMARRYELDLFAEQTRILVKASEEKYPAAVRIGLANLALDLAAKAIRADSFETAEQLAKAARAYANMSLGTKGRDPNTVRRANELVEAMPWYREQRDRAVEAEKTLAQDPGNAKVAQFLGMYWALGKEQWERGLPLLLKSDDATLRALAEAEQAAKPSATAAEMVKLAEQWRDAAANFEAPYRPAAHRRAAHWYQIALPYLTGETKKRVLRELDALR